MLDTSYFSKRLKSERLKQGMTQKELSQKSGVAPATISSYEGVNDSKTKYPPIDKAIALANALNVSLDWLCGGNESVDDKVIDPECYPLTTLIEDLMRVIQCADNFSVSTDDWGKQYLSINIETASLCNFVESWKKIKALKEDGTISESMHDDWLSGSLAKYDGWFINLKCPSHIFSKSGEIKPQVENALTFTQGLGDSDLPY